MLRILAYGGNAETPIEHLEVYQEFMKGTFEVKTNRGCSNAISTDLKLEQTIQRPKRSTSGIIVQTRKENLIIKWKTVYHEILVISNCFNDRTQPNRRSREVELLPHQELSWQ